MASERFERGGESGERPWRVALIQLGYAESEPVAERIERAAAMVRAQRGADFVVLPELWAPTGFGYRRWADHAEELDGPTGTAIAAAAADIGAVVHAGSIVERLPEPGPEGNAYANTSLVFGADGARLAAYRKIHRFGFAEGEPSLMEAGTDIVVVDLPRAGGGGEESAAGAASRSIRVGLSTCYDLRFPELYRAQVDLGAEVFVVPAAWPAARVGAWTLLGRARAIEDQCIVIACNTAGTHDGIAMGGRSQIVGPFGELWAQAGEDEQVLAAEIDLSSVSAARARFPVLADRRLPH